MTFTQQRSLQLSLGALFLAVAALAPVRAQNAPSAPSMATTAVAPAPAPAPAPMAASADATEGKIAWYGSKFNGRKTASGQRFNSAAMTMAHKTLPFGTKVRVTNLANNRSVVLRVNDRGPTTADRVGDVSAAAARKLGMQRAGVANAKLEIVSMGK